MAKKKIKDPRLGKGHSKIRVGYNASDPFSSQFFTFLEKDIRDNSQHLSAMSPELLKRISSLTKGVDIDLDSPLADEDE